MRIIRHEDAIHRAYSRPAGIGFRLTGPRLPAWVPAAEARPRWQAVPPHTSARPPVSGRRWSHQGATTAISPVPLMRHVPGRYWRSHALVPQPPPQAGTGVDGRTRLPSAFEFAFQNALCGHSTSGNLRPFVRAASKRRQRRRRFPTASNWREVQNRGNRGRPRAPRGLPAQARAKPSYSHISERLLRCGVHNGGAHCELDSIASDPRWERLMKAP